MWETDALAVLEFENQLVVVMSRPIFELDTRIGYDQVAVEATHLLHYPPEGFLSLSFDTIDPDHYVAPVAVELESVPFALVGETDPAYLRNARLQALWQIALYTVLPSIAIVVLLRLTFLRFTHQLISRLDETAREKDLLIRESNHRFKNNFAMAESFLQIQLLNTDNTHAQEALRKAQSQIAGMRVLYEQLLRTEKHEAVDVQEYLESLSKTTVSVYAHGRQIALECNVKKFLMESSRAFSVGAVVTELLTNSLKYAFPEREHGVIRLSLRVDTRNNGDAEIVLSVCDDGIGYPETFKPQSDGGLGLSIVRMTAEQLGGSVIFGQQERSDTTDPGGACTVISFPRD